MSKGIAQFVPKIEKLSHIMVPTPILKIARAYGLPSPIMAPDIIIIVLQVSIL